jgi:serine phosphatase RsbU (regulator of sigma subunit)
VSVAAPGRHARPAILLIEDDHGDAVLVQACLADAGIGDSEVTWVRTYADAFAALDDEPGCILLDLGLPDAAGVPAVQALALAAPNTPVIVLTGRQERDGGDSLAAGAQDYLVKDSLNGEVLERSIRYAVERKRSEHSRRLLSSSVAERARLERGLLPVPLLSSGSIECSTYYRPGNDGAVLGGDFFDVVEQPDGTVRAIIGDVMGHGPDEAALGVHLRVAWRTLLLSGADEATVLPLMARLLTAEQGGQRRFTSVCDISITGETMTTRVAGHPAPVIATAGRCHYADVAVGVPLGVGDRADWPTTTVALPQGSSVVLYTDGLLDAYVPQDTTTSIGVEELVAAVADCAADGEPIERWLPRLVARAPRAAADDTAAVLLTTRAR